MSRTIIRVVALALIFLAPAAAAQIPAAEYEERRGQLAAQLGDGVLLVLGAPEPPQDYLPFYQAPTFRYLTGVDEPGAALVMVRRGTSTTTTLFVRPRDPRTETWSGPRLGTERATRATGLAAVTADRLHPVLDSLLGAGLALHVAGEYRLGANAAPPISYDQQVLERIRERHPSAALRDVTPLVRRLRARKSDAELTLIRRAAAITVEAHRDAMRAMTPGWNEFEIQALIEYDFRRYGAERPAFASIVGSGPNSVILHYNRNDRFMQAGEVVVIDIGASYAGYAADITRTIPVSGAFSPEQRAIYQIVRDAQAAAERAAQVGAQWSAVTQIASRTLAEGLARVGLIEAPDATYDCGNTGSQQQCPQLSLFYFHGLGHGIGLDVHDPDQALGAGGTTIQLGSAFTIEPGIYVRSNVLDLIPDTPRNRQLIARIRPLVTRHANIGVRIEDDYIVTAQGVEWISRAPREIDEVEALMRESYVGPHPRRAEWVDWYR
ncbi:MAG TPA: aminopeptidase P N-terminal domain-containing protein [Gemmatimonadaceae bacterium]|nr:aminopeptidase P N-terminal domain-containing protein [Gemmatimonadaceae bacterium]